MSSNSKKRMRLDVPHAEPQTALPQLSHGSDTPLTTIDGTLAFACSLMALFVYLLTLGPTVTGEDSGELAAAAYTLGIPHPPGYPVWTMLGKLFTFLPFGTVAWRVNLMSAVFAALTVGLTFLLSRKLSLPRWAAVAGALAFAFSREFWEQSVIAEVYTLNAFFFAACLLLLFVWQAQRNTTTLLALGLFYGLSLGNHNTMALLGPVFVGFVLWCDRQPWQQWRAYAGAALVAVLVACAVHLYLPIRSLDNPPVDWGNPETWDNFVDVVTRAQYSFMFTEDPRSLTQFGRQAWTLGALFLDQFSPWVGIIAIAGLVPLVWRNRVRGGLLVVVLVWLTLGYLLVLNTRMERETIWVSTVFYIPSWLLLGLGLSAALAWLQAWMLRLGWAGGGGSILAAALMLASVASPLAWNYGHNDRSGYRYTEDMARNILLTLEQDAIYFPSADHATFPVMYLQAVEGMRPDVAIANKYGYPEPMLYHDMPGRENFHKIPNAQEERLIENWIIENSGRSVYFSAKRGMGDLPGYELREEGLLFRVVRPEDARPERDLWAEYQWSSLDEGGTAGELTADYVLSDVFYMQGRSELAKEKPEAALPYFDKVAAINPDNKETLNNLGSACAERSLLDAAVRYLEMALAADPAYGTALVNLAKVHIQQGEHPKAILRLEELLKVDDRNIEAVQLSAESLAAIRWHDEAIERYEYLTRLTPNDPAIYKALGDLYFNHKDDHSTAQQYYATSLQLDPSQPDLQEKLAQLATPQLPEMPELPGAPSPTDSLPGLPGVPGTANLPMPSLPNAGIGTIPSLPAGIR